MSKWYKVRVERWQDVLVEVEDSQGEDEALSAAMTECVSGKPGDGEAKNAVLVDPKNLASEKRHADITLPL
jgi:hypothetical protein